MELSLTHFEAAESQHSPGLTPIPGYHCRAVWIFFPKTWEHGGEGITCLLLE